MERLSSVATGAGSVAFVSRQGNGEGVERRLQGVFAAVLEQVGREGYASVEPLAEQASNASQIGTAWEEWFEQMAPRRYTFVAGSESPSVREGKKAEDLRADYRQILEDAYRDGGYATPQAYLRGLSREALATIQQVQHLAEPIEVERLSDEASLNLLLPPDTQVDVDGDGITTVGAARTLRFPDSRTPAAVRDAWDQATEGMPEGDRMTYALMMAHPWVETDGAVEVVRPEPRVEADSVEAYLEKGERWLKYLEDFKGQISVEQYARDKGFWSRFQEALSELTR